MGARSGQNMKIIFLVVYKYLYVLLELILCTGINYTWCYNYLYVHLELILPALINFTLCYNYLFLVFDAGINFSCANPS